jgi:hypothetical protein
VVSGLATEDVFAGALLGEAHSWFHYRGCDAVLRVVVGEPAMALFPDETLRWQSHGFQTTCPVCGESWFASILEFIDVEASRSPLRWL